MAVTYRTFSAAGLEELDQRFRTQLINSIGGFKSVALVGTRSNDGAENLAIVNSIVHIGAHPPLIGMLFRPDVVERHTLSNIRETGVYTINHIQANWVDRAHQTAARYPREVSEFAASGLTPHYENGCQAPFVEEAEIRLELHLREEIPVQSNGTVLLIGEVRAIRLPEHCLGTDGFVYLEKAGTVAGSGLDGYFSVTEICRLTYAKPNRWPAEIHP